MSAASERLTFIFGSTSSGDTPEQRAATSDRNYVRSQIQLAFWSEGAGGIRINARQALRTFGIDLLERVAEDGAAGLATDPAQPAITFQKRRRFLNVSKPALATAAKVPLKSVVDAETVGTITPIRDLERIAQLLSLDERLLSFREEALGDKKLGARLKSLNPTAERDDRFIIALSDAAWVIARETELAAELRADEGLVGKFKSKLNDYNKPAYRKGYELAERTRALLNLSPTDPIPHLRRLVEDQIGIAVVDADLGADVAGATIGNGGARGIALGPEHRPLVRRMTLAHELGHLLWDPEPILDRVRIDRADEAAERQSDPVEIRANAFGIAFLAPREAVKAIYDETGSLEKAVERLVEKYGVSLSAAVNHLRSICDLSPFKVRYQPSQEVFHQWATAEMMTSQVPDAPVSRRGRFAKLVLDAVAAEIITRDTAARWLRVDEDSLPV